MKICKACNTSLSLDNFIKDKTRTDGLYVYCKTCNKDRRRLFREANKEKLSASKKEYYYNNKKDISLRKKEKYLIMVNNPEFIKNKRKKNSLWKKRNKGIINRYTAKRRAFKLKASYDWGEFDSFIKEEAYLLAALRSNLTNTIWEVDHIVPLINENVCGLHVGVNLQVITRKDNLSKSNKFII